MKRGDHKQDNRVYGKLLVTVLSAALAFGTSPVWAAPVNGNGPESAGIEEVTAAQTSSEPKVFSADYCDLVATVEGGQDGDVSFAGGSENGGSFLIVNTDKNVTISMKEGIESTIDYIYVPAPIKSTEARHVTLDGVHIDRSEEEVFYQGIDLVTGLSGEARAALYGLYFPGSVVQNISGGTQYEGSVRMTLKGNNVIKGAKSSNIRTNEYSSNGYEPAADAVHAGIWAMNLQIDGNGSLNSHGPEYGIYVKRTLTMTGGCLAATCEASGKKELFCNSSLITGGCFAQGGSGKVYGQTIYAGTVNNKEARLCELTNNTDDQTKDAYPYKVAYTKDAKDFLGGMIARSVLAEKDNGEDYESAYDMALTCLDAYAGGSSVSLSYGMNYGFDMGQSLALVHALQNDHPEYWWLWIDMISPGSSGASVVLKNGYSKAKVESQRAKFEAAVKTVLQKSGVTAGMSDEAKAYVLYQALASSVSYNKSFVDQSANSAFTEGQAVCDGFAKAYIYLLQKQGISASYVEGWGGDEVTGGMHGWVIVSMNGSFYYCDPTWDGMDESGVASFNNYMLNASDFAQKGHKVHANDMGYVLPTANQVSLGAPAASDIATVTAAACSGGVLYPGSIKVIKGSPLQVTALPEEGKSLDTLTAGGNALNASEDENGTFYVTIASVSADTELAATFKDGSKTSTLLTSDKEDLSVIEGETATVTVCLQDKKNLALSGKQISLTLFPEAALNGQGTTYTAETYEDGLAVFSFPDLPVGVYRIVAAFGGDDGYRPSRCLLSLTILENAVYEVGDFVLQRTGGGTLSETDYTYSETSDDHGKKIDGSGVLMINTSTPITISMRDDVSISHDRIGIGTSSGFVAQITLKNIVIDRSSLVIEGTACDTGVYNPVPKDADLTAGLFTQNDDQNSVIILEGYNVITSATTSTTEQVEDRQFNPPMLFDQNTVGYYAAISSGGYTFEGSGVLELTAKTDQDIGSAYGINGRKISVKSGTLKINVSGKKCSMYGIDSTYYTQDGGEVTVSLGDKELDVQGSMGSLIGVETHDLKLTGGNLELALSKYGTYTSDYGIEAMDVNGIGGSLLIDGFRTGIAASQFGNGVKLSNLMCEIRDYDKAFKEGAAIKIESGLYKEGNVADQTIYGVQVLGGATIFEETKNGESWYRVKDARGMDVAGGEEGVDYIYSGGAYTLLTDKAMTFTMREGVQKTDNRILSGGGNNTTYKITLNNVIMDRSAVTAADAYDNYEDEIIRIDKGNLELTLTGSNRLLGSENLAYWESGSKRYNCDNTAILVKEGTLTVGGTGSLLIKEPNVSYSSAGIIAFAYTQNGGTVEIETGKDEKGFFALIANTYFGYVKPEETGSGNITLNAGTLKASIKGGQTSDPDYTKAAAVYADGIVTLNDGSITAIMDSSGGCSTGLYAGQGITVKKGTLSASGGSAALKSIGIRCGGDLILSGGQISATGAQAGFNEESIGLMVASDVKASGGKLTAMGGSAEAGYSYGMKQESETGHVNFSGAEVTLKGGDTNRSSYGGHIGGHMLISGGTVTALGGKSKDERSIGLYNGTDCEAQITGGALTLTGADAYLASAGLFEGSLDGGLDLVISGGTINATGGKVTEPGPNPVAAGIYVYDKLQIKGGKIKAAGQLKSIDCQASDITGGSFAQGDVTAGTVYGMKIASGCTMEKGTDADYP
ncbi:MAG: hypothetical protein K6E18_02970, partial [Lachnospiraceae bacterium]|nr:hypothetical protein [Lachnospiraceae bacterium]